MVTILDDFEDGNIGGYQGGTTYYEVQSENVYNGSYALEMSNSTVGEVMYNPNITFGQGDTPFGVYLAGGQSSSTWGTGSSTAGFIFGGSDNGEAGYAIWVDAYNGDFNIDLKDGGDYTDLADETGLSMTVGEYYEVKVNTWDSNGQIECVLRDTSGNTISTLSVTDNTYTKGFIAWDNSNEYSNTDIAPLYDYLYAPGPPSAPSNLQATLQ